MRIFVPVILCSIAVSTAAFVVPFASPRRAPSLNARRKKEVNAEAEAEAEEVPHDDPSQSDPAKTAALQSVLNQIERSYGRGSIVKLGDSAKFRVDCLTTGALTLDVALGGHGYPKGRVVEIYGPESSGKTTLALHAIAAAQAEGGTAAFIDAEHALDPQYAKRVGVNTDELLLTQPDSGEMALDVCDQLIRSRAVDVIVIDSVAALVPRAELEGNMGDAQIGLQARLMSKALRKITGTLAQSKCLVIFINQLRQKVGVIYGSPEVTAGGNALKFYASVRLDTRRQEILPNSAGIRIKVKVVKNKIAPPFRLINLDINFGAGVDRIGDVVNVATEMGVMERKGSWYAYKGSNLAQGRQNVVQLLEADEEMLAEIEQTVRDLVVSSNEEETVSTPVKKSAPTAMLSEVESD